LLSLTPFHGRDVEEVEEEEGEEKEGNEEEEEDWPRDALTWKNVKT
jgi:hypothetical protein